MKEDNWDELFDQAFDEAVDKKVIIPIPDYSSSWENIKGELKPQKATPPKRRFLLPIAASFLIGAFLFGSPLVSKAFTPLYDTIKDIKDSVVVFVFGSNESSHSSALTTPPDEQSGIDEGSDGQDLLTIEKSYDTWEEALTHLSFSPIHFNYIPSGYKPFEFRLFTLSGEKLSNNARLVYENDALDKLMIKVRKLSRNEVASSSHFKGDGEYEVIKIKDVNGYYFNTNHGQSSLEFLLGNIQIGIYGSLTQEEFIKMAENIK